MTTPTPTPVNNFFISLTFDEVNQVLSSLGKQSFADVYILINNIQNQAQAQVSAAGAVKGSEPNLGDLGDSIEEDKTED